MRAGPAELKDGQNSKWMRPASQHSAHHSMQAVEEATEMGHFNGGWTKSVSEKLQNYSMRAVEKATEMGHFDVLRYDMDQYTE